MWRLAEGQTDGHDKKTLQHTDTDVTKYSAQFPSNHIDIVCNYLHVSICYDPRHGISNYVVCATSKGSDQPAHMRSLIRAYARPLNIL